ncbi:MAG: glycerol acyltransferase [Flavobacteriaceae bacterium]|nr:glycerol acyltransferase [Flavobacteriaceae bacterium]
MEHIPKNKPTLIICNHQNALIDALIIATQIPHYAHYLTRAGVFTGTFINKFLNSLNMLPVYRIRDGWSNLPNNNPIFKKVTKLLIHSQTVVIFPEGSHNLVRRVRPLSKGFTRIIFDALEEKPNLDLKLIPVGLNFIKAEACVDGIAMNVGPPIPIDSFENRKKGEIVAEIKSKAHNALSQLTTHIPADRYDEIVGKIEALNLDYLDPKTINACIATGFENCKPRPQSKLNFIKRILKFLLILNLLIPYLLWKFWVQPKIVEIEFTSTFRFGIAIVIVPIYLIAIFFILSNWIGMQWALYYILFVLALDLLTVKL